MDDSGFAIGKGGKPKTAREACRQQTPEARCYSVAIPFQPQRVKRYPNGRREHRGFRLAEVPGISRKTPKRTTRKRLYV